MEVFLRLIAFAFVYMVISWVCEDHGTWFFKWLFIPPAALIILYPLFGILARKAFKDDDD
jgi:hypothetical protein